MIPIAFIDKTKCESSSFPDFIAASHSLCAAARTLKVLKCPNPTCNRELTFNKGCARNKPHFCHVGERVNQHSNSERDECLSCNESVEHLVVKKFLQYYPNSLTIQSVCCECDGTHVIIPEFVETSMKLEQSACINGNKYTIDVFGKLNTRSGVLQGGYEVVKTHFCTLQKYVDIRNSDYVIFEVPAIVIFQFIETISSDLNVDVYDIDGLCKAISQSTEKRRFSNLVVNDSMKPNICKKCLEKPFYNLIDAHNIVVHELKERDPCPNTETYRFIKTLHCEDWGIYHWDDYVKCFHALKPATHLTETNSPILFQYDCFDEYKSIHKGWTEWINIDDSTITRALHNLSQSKDMKYTVKYDIRGHSYETRKTDSSMYSNYFIQKNTDTSTERQVRKTPTLECNLQFNFEYEHEPVLDALLQLKRIFFDTLEKQRPFVKYYSNLEKWWRFANSQRCRMISKKLVAYKEKENKKRQVENEKTFRNTKLARISQSINTSICEYQEEQCKNNDEIHKKRMTRWKHELCLLQNKKSKDKYHTRLAQILALCPTFESHWNACCQT